MLHHYRSSTVQDLPLLCASVVTGLFRHNPLKLLTATAIFLVAYRSDLISCGSLFNGNHIHTQEVKTSAGSPPQLLAVRTWIYYFLNNLSGPLVHGKLQALIFLLTANLCLMFLAVMVMWFKGYIAIEARNSTTLVTEHLLGPN
jgi:hypothetical protein